MHDDGIVVGQAAAAVHTTLEPELLHGGFPPVTVTVAQQTGVDPPHPAGLSHGDPPSPEPLLEPELDPELEPLLDPDPELDPLLDPELDPDPLLDADPELDPLPDPELDPLLPPDPELDPDVEPELDPLLASIPESAPLPPPVLLLPLLHDSVTKRAERASARMGIEACGMSTSLPFRPKKRSRAFASAMLRWDLTLADRAQWTRRAGGGRRMGGREGAPPRLRRVLRVGRRASRREHSQYLLGVSRRRVPLK